jgi:hypothetical protein
MKYALRIDAPTPSQNVRDAQHWALRRRVKTEWSWRIRAASTFLSIPKATGKRRLTIERHFKGKPQDEANIHGGSKGIVDALVEWKLLVDDSPDWIEHEHPVQLRLAPRQKPFTVLILEDIA